MNEPISIGLSRASETEGRYAVVHGAERFHPTHENPDERERFLAFFGELELEDKLRVLEGINRPELIEELTGVHPSQMERVLDDRVARWIEENERLVQYRAGSLTCMERKAHEDEESREPFVLTGDEDPSFREGFLDRLVTESRDPALRNGFTKFEARLANLWESAKGVKGDSLERSRECARVHGWSYLTVIDAPQEGRPPEWVRTAWENVSIPAPRLSDGSIQAPGTEDVKVWVDDAILSLMAEGKQDAAWWWIGHYQDFHGNMLLFKAEDVRLKHPR